MNKFKQKDRSQKVAKQQAVKKKSLKTIGTTGYPELDKKPSIEKIRHH